MGVSTRKLRSNISTSQKKKGTRSPSSRTAAAATATAVSTNRKKKKQKMTIATTTKTTRTTRSVTAAAVREAKAIRYQNIMSQVSPENWYHITMFLDEVELYCLEEAFPIQINTPDVSHQRWKYMLEMQQQVYTSPDIAMDLIRMLQRNNGLLTDVVPRWPPPVVPQQNHNDDDVDIDIDIISPMARGRQFAQQLLHAKQELVRYSQQREYSRNGGILEHRFTRTEYNSNDMDDLLSLLSSSSSRDKDKDNRKAKDNNSYDDAGYDSDIYYDDPTQNEVFVTLVTHEGYHFATSMPKSSQIICISCTPLPSFQIFIEKQYRAPNDGGDTCFQVRFTKQFPKPDVVGHDIDICAYPDGSERLHHNGTVRKFIRWNHHNNDSTEVAVCHFMPK